MIPAATRNLWAALVQAAVWLPAMLHGGVEWSGHLMAPTEGQPHPLAAVRVFGFPDGRRSAAAGDPVTGSAFRTWEMAPRGWWHLEGQPGQRTILFTGPAHFLRPAVLTVSGADGEKQSNLRPAVQFDYSCFGETQWDPQPARAYYQPFRPAGRSVTHVGFKLATDGVDGAGPLGQDVLISLHRVTAGPPESWPQCGPAVCVPNVDCGGPKSYHFSAGWHSGQARVEPGQWHAVRLQPRENSRGIQAFWSAHAAEADPAARCWRVRPNGTAAPEPWRLWLTVDGDGDGLLIPCNKCVHREFGEFAGFAPRWTQTWKAQGSSLAGIFLHAATSGVQPPMDRQRVLVRIRADGPDGKSLGPEKIAAAQCNYTGDASWGVFGVVFSKGEISLTPGQTCAADFQTLETPESIGNFVNAKGQKSDGKPGFNPYRRHSDDPYPNGRAWKNGTSPAAFPLDMQVVEYE